MMQLKPGGAERLRKKMASGRNFASRNQKLVDRLGMIHDMMYITFDNDTRLLFA
jgi:hypothetical protein